MIDRASYNNPYIVGSPVSGLDMFFGRRDIFEWIRLNLVGAHHDQPLIIAGQRRTGKTSVLKQIENGRLGNRYVAIFLDLQGFYIEDSVGFLWELASSASLNLDAYQIDAPVLDEDRFFANPYREFQEQWLTPILEALGQRRLLFLFDETEVMEERFRNGRLDRSIFDYLRSLVQNNPDISMIFGMGHKLETFSQESIRLFNIALFKQISYLSPIAAAELISKPVPYEVSGDTIKAILRLTSGHPYYTQLVCHTLFERWQMNEIDVPTADYIPQIIEAVLERGSAALAYIWLYEGVTTDERLLMSALATLVEQGRSTSLSEIQALLEQHEVFLTRTALVDAVEGLEDQQIIINRGDLTFQVELIYHWLRQERPLGWTIAQALKVSRLAEQYATAAQILLDRGDSSEAQAEYERALREDPTHIRSLLGVSQIAMKNQEWSQASLGYERVLVLHDAHQIAQNGFVKARLGRAKRNLANGRLPDAEADYRAILALQSGHDAALHGLEELYAKKGALSAEKEEFDEAVQAYQSWADIAIDPTAAQQALAALNGLIYRKLADRLRAEAERAVENGYWLGAIQALSALTEVNAPDVEDVPDLLCYAQGRAAFEAKNFQTAVEYFEPLHRRDPNYRNDLDELYQHAVAMIEAPLTDLSITVGQHQIPWSLQRWFWVLIGATGMALLFGGVIFGPQLLQHVINGPSPTPSKLPEVVVLEPAVTETIAPVPTVTATNELVARPFATAVLSTSTAVPPTPTPSFPLTLTRPSDSMVMHLMSGGRFLQGASDTDDQADNDERPQHEVSLDPFYIDRHEVTVSQYVLFLQRMDVEHRRGCGGESCVQTRFETLFSHIFWDGNRVYRSEPLFETHPVTGVSWHGANAYCQAIGGRLPTESEWEYAARSQGTAPLIYPWGDAPATNRLALFGQSQFALLRAVGSFPEGHTARGLMDMAGNVAEWTNDGYDADYYRVSPVENPMGPDPRPIYVVRGGSWQSEAEGLRVSSRAGLAPTTSDSSVGFRCVVPID